MPRNARRSLFDPENVGVYHCTNRCVRRAYLCGRDGNSGRNFEHRREWIRDQLEYLSGFFAIDCITYTVMENHLHVVLRNRPDIAETWSAREVAVRWLHVCPRRRDSGGVPREPTEVEIAMITSRPELVQKYRRRLSNISWLMGRIAQRTAIRANKEDGVKGRFWEGRFAAQPLLDEGAVLACAAYVDLNPVRAAIAATPEASVYTGAYDRIQDLREESEAVRQGEAEQLGAGGQGQRRTASGWLSPVPLNEAGMAGPEVSRSGLRASDKGFAGMSTERYVELIDWTGRQVRVDKIGSIPDSLAPILERLGIEATGWCFLVQHFGRCFGRAAGKRELVAGEAERRGERWRGRPGPAILSGGGKTVEPAEADK